jgi:hypothetical protein
MLTPPEPMSAGFREHLEWTAKPGQLITGSPLRRLDTLER